MKNDLRKIRRKHLANKTPKMKKLPSSTVSQYRSKKSVKLIGVEWGNEFEEV